MYDVTVAIPAYNAEHSIERSLRSLQDQTWTGRLEILVCDDGSTDRTCDVVTGMAAHDGRIRLLKNECNRGRPFTRNRLATEASGDMLTWLDADDVKYPDMIRAQMDKFFLLRHQLGHERFLVYTNYDWDFTERAEKKVMAPNPTKDVVKALLDGTFGAYLWITLGKKSTFRLGLPFEEALPRLQDLDVFLRMGGRGVEFHRVDTPEPQCRYNKEDKGRSSLEVEQCFAVIRHKHKFLIDLYGRTYMRELVQKHLSVAARFALSNGDIGRAQRYALRKSLVRRVAAWRPA
jgi:glycosyltransferase involved in cell wall biosynthesis